MCENFRRMADGLFVACYRVSTKRQGISGLGHEAEHEAIRSNLNGGESRLAVEVTEVKCGKRSDQPMLDEALRLCRPRRATLVIAKLDRLARNVAFIFSLMEAGTEFVTVDFPQDNRLIVHIVATVAAARGECYLKRTKVALVVKAR